jgi:hypothetical protein
MAEYLIASSLYFLLPFFSVAAKGTSRAAATAFFVISVYPVDAGRVAATDVDARRTILRHAPLRSR